MNQRDATSRFNLHTVNLEGLTADPTDVQDGDVWYRSDVPALKCRINGVTKTVTVS